jgi:hypothetical protein
MMLVECVLYRMCSIDEKEEKKENVKMQKREKTVDAFA